MPQGARCSPEGLRASKSFLGRPSIACHNCRGRLSRRLHGYRKAADKLPATRHGKLPPRRRLSNNCRTLSKSCRTSCSGSRASGRSWPDVGRVGATSDRCWTEFGKQLPNLGRSGPKFVICCRGCQHVGPIRPRSAQIGLRSAKCYGTRPRNANHRQREQTLEEWKPGPRTGCALRCIAT